MGLINPNVLLSTHESGLKDHVRTLEEGGTSDEVNNLNKQVTVSPYTRVAIPVVEKSTCGCGAADFRVVAIMNMLPRSLNDEIMSPSIWKAINDKLAEKQTGVYTVRTQQLWISIFKNWDS